jgi:hypothetical protein
MKFARMSALVSTTLGSRRLLRSLIDEARALHGSVPYGSERARLATVPVEQHARVVPASPSRRR